MYYTLQALATIIVGVSHYKTAGDNSGAWVTTSHCIFTSLIVVSHLVYLEYMPIECNNTLCYQFFLCFSAN